jgi:peptidoglycan hydrolase CwlO-like protein
MDAISTISTAFSAITVFISVIALVKGFSKDSKENSNSLIRVETKIDSMGEQITEVRDDVKVVGVRQQDMAERLATVEDSVKSAHHRIDGLENKIK